MTLTLTPSEYRKAGLPERDETQMLLAVHSRYEDMGGKRVHIMPELSEPVLVSKRGKPEGLHVPTTDAANDLDLLAEYGVETHRPLWVRPPFILPASWAPWSLEPGRQYWLRTSQLSTPFPDSSSLQKRWEWSLENINLCPTFPFLPHCLPEAFKDATLADISEANVRLWADARGPSPGRQYEIQSILFAANMRGEGIEGYAPILPNDRSALTRPPLPNPPDLPGGFAGSEEPIWAAILDDPDLDLFGLDEDESCNPCATKNLFIESDNLLALKRLRRGYQSKVKMSYIDPPYNTGNTFIYNDNFNAAPNTGSPFTGQRWGKGTWLTCMMAPWVNDTSGRRLIPVDDTMLNNLGGAR